MAARYRITVGEVKLTEKRRQMERGEIEEFETPNFTVVRDPQKAYLREERDSPALIEALRPIEDQAGLAYFWKWRVCPLCVRAFPVTRDARNAKTCAPCRRRFTRREIQNRLAHAPKIPVEYQYFKPNEEPQLAYLLINPKVMSVRAPLRRGLDPRPAGYLSGPNKSDT